MLSNAVKINHNTAMKKIPRILASILAMCSCSLRLTPEGGKEVVIDGAQAIKFGKALYDAKNAQKVQP